MKLSRRDFMKANAVAAAAAAAGLTIPTVAQAVVGGADEIKWDKAPCRFAVLVVVCWLEHKMVASWLLKGIQMRRLTVA